MQTDQAYRVLAGQSYAVEPGAKSVTITSDSVIESDELEYKYEVIEVKNNTANGMQAMAVAPIVNGKPDTSQIIIA